MNKFEARYSPVYFVGFDGRFYLRTPGRFKLVDMVTYNTENGTIALNFKEFMISFHMSKLTVKEINDIHVCEINRVTRNLEHCVTKARDYK